MDRNSGNILVKKEGDFKLIPIDHGLSFPDRIDIAKEEVKFYKNL